MLIALLIPLGLAILVYATVLTRAAIAAHYLFLSGVAVALVATAWAGWFGPPSFDGHVVSSGVAGLMVAAAGASVGWIASRRLSEVHRGFWRSVQPALRAALRRRE